MKKLFLFISSLFLFLAFNINVNADEIDYWGYDIEHFTQGYFYDCLNSNSCSSEINTAPLYGFDNSTVYYPGFISAYTYLGDYGNQFDFALNQTLLVDYLYSLTIYICNMSTSNAPNFVGGFGGTSLDAVNAHTYPIDLHVGVNNTKLSNYPYYNTIDEGNSGGYSGLYCRATTMVFSPTSKTTRFGYQFNTSSVTSGSFWAVGYEITELGYTGNLTKSDISSVINSSDLATASSIDDVNDELVTIQSEISGMQEKQDVTNEKLDETNQQLSDLNSNLNDSDTSDATNEAGNFFSGFETDTFGLTSIITAPLNLIGSITSSTCSPLGLQVPFVENTTLNLPCMTTIYQNYFGSFLSVYQTITFGIVAYWVCVRIFALVKDFKNPDHDEIEVLDL